jgi:hypothetical protein
MGLLDSFERGLERAVNGAFAKTFRSGVQPVEISSALRRELDTKAAVVSRDRILVPNEFSVRLAPPDFTRMNDVGRPLVDELTQMVQQHAVAQNYSFSGPVTIRLQQDGTLSTGILQIDATTVQRDVAWVAVLDIGSQRHKLQRGRTSAAARTPTSPWRTPGPAGSTSRSCGTASTRKPTTWAPRTARS